MPPISLAPHTHGRDAHNEDVENPQIEVSPAVPRATMRAELIGHFKPCMTDIYLYIDARVADYIHTHPYYRRSLRSGATWRLFSHAP